MLLQAKLQQQLDNAQAMEQLLQKDVFAAKQMLQQAVQDVLFLQKAMADAEVAAQASKAQHCKEVERLQQQLAMSAAEQVQWVLDCTCDDGGLQFSSMGHCATSSPPGPVGTLCSPKLHCTVCTTTTFTLPPDLHVDDCCVLQLAQQAAELEVKAARELEIVAAAHAAEKQEMQRAADAQLQRCTAQHASECEALRQMHQQALEQQQAAHAAATKAAADRANTEAEALRLAAAGSQAELEKQFR